MMKRFAAFLFGPGKAHGRPSPLDGEQHIRFSQRTITVQTGQDPQSGNKFARQILDPSTFLKEDHSL
jgi:hypothetical protein